MILRNPELVVFALALLSITVNIILCSWALERKQLIRFVAWFIRFTAILPGFLAVAWGLYESITKPDSTLGTALFSAGLLLEFGALQLLSILLRHTSRS